MTLSSVLHFHAHPQTPTPKQELDGKLAKK